ncbi:MAG: hypothetical protein HOK52_01010 [Candidatus Marinimicrobia bacterium]|jgi:DNA repair photolyase|nr:hypothetical protein [Candidatus Neomarinimicrobiota bacterium]MBT6938515.1 hypothetical protein [Candidatus Neomarinimicrobiota bacterium]MBT7270492.1 hypothetical protein [Candidatus Neomarinimicrobiota bacterium]
MAKNVIIHKNVGKALTPQKKIDQHNLPFTCNSAMGCLFECEYCYLQNFPFNLHADFGNEVKIKTWIPGELDKELEKQKGLPPHLKRVQVNTASEGYLPWAIKEVKKQLNRDIMKEVLEVFQKHWNNGNRWMVHLLTKSHLVKNHLELIAEMKEQVQLELTITTLDETKARLLEKLAPSVKKRLDVIDTFSKKDVFVRVMCMPLIGDEKEARKIKKSCLNNGAKAFKHKGVNYWDEQALLNGNVVSKGGKKDLVYKNILLKSGEDYLVDGNTQSGAYKMPDKKWQTYAMKDMTFVDFGYTDMNSFYWGYVK